VINTKKKTFSNKEFFWTEKEAEIIANNVCHTRNGRLYYSHTQIHIQKKKVFVLFR
jgi:hypothetical protein